MQEKSSPSSSTAAGTPAKVKTDSWMEDTSIARSFASLTTTTSSHGKNVRKFSNILEMERFSNSNVVSMDDSSTAVDYNPIDDIPVLPDADDIHESLLYNESPNLPTFVASEHVTTYKNLSSDIFTSVKASALGNLDEIDISILTECLESEEDIEEPDEVWTWDQLFTQLSVKISTESKTSVVEFSN
uniref:Uncharacterized protein n=1 Tax=Anopheles farauti TaxID=69004 RepID=A0A182QSQ4_9DIPT